MAKLPELDIAKRAVQEGALPQDVLDACLSEKRKARADGLDLTLRELLQEKGFFSAQAWDALERRASTNETRGDLRPAGRAAQVTAPSTSSRLIPTAEFLGEYRIIKEIGRGAMGIVYEAIQGTLGRRVALKVLPAGTAMSGVARERFNREARAAASLNHPNIVPIYDQGEERGVPFFAMELVNGRTLKDVLNEEGPLDTNRAVALGIQAARALDYAHERGVIHRDVKPDNLFLQSPKKTKSKSGTHEKEKVLLADFGLATRLDDATLTREGTAVGTPLYMSPEQASGDREHTDRRADVYGLGATLYELLSGTPPFSGSPDTQTLLARIRDEEVVALRLKIDQQRKAGTPRAPVDIPPALEAVVMRTLEKDPNRRYWTAGELADDLEAFLQGEPVSAKPPTLVERLRRLARRRARWLSLVLALFVFVGILVALGAPVQRRWRADTILIQATDMERGGRRDEARRLLDEALALVPSHANARARLASLLLAEGETRRARDELDRAVNDDGRCLEARLLRGDLERRAGELDKALEDYDAATKLTEGDPRPHYGRGAVLVAKGDMTAAAKELGRGLELARASRTHTADDPGYREAVRLSGEARTAVGDAPGAQTDLEEAIRLDPDAPSPRILLGKMLAARGQDKLAVEAFSDAIRRKPDDAEAIELRAASRRRIGQATDALADLAADVTKDRPRAHLVRGLILSESLDPGDKTQDFEYDRARVELESAAQADKDALEPRDRARALVALAWIELAPGQGSAPVSSRSGMRLQHALEKLDAAASLQPDDLAIRLARGLVQVRGTRPDKARADLEAALAKKELVYSASVGLGRLALAEGKDDDALGLASKACDLDPLRPAAHELKARVLALHRDFARAREERALAARPLPEALLAPLHDVVDPLEASERAAARGLEAFDVALKDQNRPFNAQLAREVAWLRRALALDPERPALTNQLGFALYLLAKPPDAYAAFGQARALDPTLLEAELGRGLIERDFATGSGGGPRAAAQTIGRAIELAAPAPPEGDPAFAASARYELARALDESGDPERALEQAEICCRENPRRHAAAALRARLLARLKRPDAHAACRAAAKLLHEPVDAATQARAQLFLRAGDQREHEKDARTAILFFTRAIELDPASGEGWRKRGMRSFAASPFDDFARAFVDMATAIELDPRASSSFHTEIENNYYKYRRLADTFGEFGDKVTEVVDSQPDLAPAQFLGGFWALVHDDQKTALARLDTAVELAPTWYLPLAYRAQARLRGGDGDGAAADLALARKLWAEDAIVPFVEAGLALSRSDRDGCFAKLDEAIKLGFHWPDTLKNVPELAPLHGTDRFDRLLDGMGGQDDPFFEGLKRKKRH